MYPEVTCQPIFISLSCSAILWKILKDNISEKKNLEAVEIWVSLSTETVLVKFGSQTPKFVFE